MMNPQFLNEPREEEQKVVKIMKIIGFNLATKNWFWDYGIVICFNLMTLRHVSVVEKELGDVWNKKVSQ
jgi:hypothetical protein